MDHWIDTVNHWLTFLLGAILAGEVLALLIGMNLPDPSEWSKIKNNTDQPVKFCANAPLFVVNSVKLVGAVGVLGLSLWNQFRPIG